MAKQNKLPGRPKANLDWDKIDIYLRAHAEGTSIASFLGIHPNTLYEACKTEHKMSFSEYSAIKKGEGKDLLRVAMFKEAVHERNVSMQVWLSKQWLGYSNRTRYELTDELSYTDEEANQPLILTASDAESDEFEH